MSSVVLDGSAAPFSRSPRTTIFFYPATFSLSSLISTPPLPSPAAPTFAGPELIPRRPIADAKPCSSLHDAVGSGHTPHIVSERSVWSTADTQTSTLRSCSLEAKIGLSVSVSSCSDGQQLIRAEGRARNDINPPGNRGTEGLVV